METVVQPLAEAELHLLTDWSEPDSARRHRVAAVSSILANIGLILFFIWLPAGTRPPEEPMPERHVTTLIDPPTPLTQKAPNKSKVTNEFNAAEVQPRQRVVVPPSPPPVEHAAQPKPFNPPPMPAPKGGSAAAPAAPPDVPKANTPVQAAPNLDLSKLTAPAPVPPQIQTEEKPKVAFENATAQTPISAGRGLVPIPGNGISEAIHQAARGNLPGGQVVGDSGAISGLGGGGIRVPSAPGLQGSAIELKSDPLGVDFRPYLSQILAAVRRNWLNVMPESVLRLGRRGKTAILFRISRTGGVTKLVIAVPSGSEPLDRAAVAGISASVPFPPLPADFKGEDIVLQFNFAYNMPRQ